MIPTYRLAVAAIIFIFFALTSSQLAFAKQDQEEKTLHDTSKKHKSYKNGKDDQVESKQDEDENEILITAKRPTTAASDETIRDKDFQFFPHRSASDLMRLVPGLHITQHTGGAKAHQIFLRGFDAEHGQDLAATLDGIPLNEVSQVHGQGYLDLHFLIPEAIKRMKILKGPYDARLGNFSTAGSIRIQTVTQMEDTARVKLGAGSFHSYSALGELSLGDAKQGLYAALQANTTDGFTDPGELRAARAFIKWHTTDASGWSMDAMYAGYGARSSAADTLPLNWIKQHKVSRFGAMDDSDRVDADRHLLGLNLQGPAWGGKIMVTGYYNFKRTRIFSDYTYYYFNDHYGDQLEQSDMRHYGGAKVSWKKAYSSGSLGDLVSELGLQWRTDAVWQTQANTVKRVRFNMMNHYRFLEHNLGLYASETWLFNDRWMFVGGLRYDGQLVSVHGFQDVKELDIYTNRVVVRNNEPRQTIAFANTVSPKLSAIYSVSDDWKLFANFGRGFVTRPARDQANQKELFPYGVTGAEIGTRWTGLRGNLSIASSLWWAHKERELVFDSEFGGTVFRGQSHRIGLEFEIRWAPIPWIWLGTDLFLTRARLKQDDSWKIIPNTPWLMMTNMVAVQHPTGIQACIRGRLLGPRDHDMGLVSDAYYVVDLVLGWETRRFGLHLEIENILDSVWYDSVFAYPTRPTPDSEVDQGLQVTPGTPFAINFFITLKI